MERVERQKSEGLNQQKLNFFTFLSNEFKTPITLIIAQIDDAVVGCRIRPGGPIRQPTTASSRKMQSGCNR